MKYVKATEKYRNIKCAFIILKNSKVHKYILQCRYCTRNRRYICSWKGRVNSTWKYRTSIFYSKATSRIQATMNKNKLLKYLLCLQLSIIISISLNHFSALAPDVSSFSLSKRPFPCSSTYKLKKTKKLTRFVYLNFSLTYLHLIWLLKWLYWKYYLIFRCIYK